MSIVVVGSINMDTTYRLSHIPIPGETIIAKDRKQNRGGKGQNQAVTIARLGKDVHIVGAVGDDDNGRKIKEDLMQDGVNTEYLYTKDASTGLANIYVDDEHHNNIVVFAGANFELTREDIQQARALFEEAEYCVMQMEIPLDVIYSTLVMCEELNVKTILNPAPVNPEFDLDYLKYVDYLIPNESELELMTGEKLTKENIPDLARTLLGYGCKNIIVTLGENGSSLFSWEEEVHSKAVKVQAADTTAAGDSYIGSLTVSLSEGNLIKDAMDFASVVSSKTVTKKGAIDSLPYRKEIDQMFSGI